MLAQPRSPWPIITSALGQCIVLSGSGTRGVKRHPHNNTDNMGQALNAVPMLGQRQRQHWVNAMCLL